MLQSASIFPQNQTYQLHSSNPSLNSVKIAFPFHATSIPSHHDQAPFMDGKKEKQVESNAPRFQAEVFRAVRGFPSLKMAVHTPLAKESPGVAVGVDQKGDVFGAV
jgi:hypothetical protein